MAFRPDEADRLLVECHHRCCICHRFCGVKMEIDHIVQSADDGPDEITNGIAVCFECHAEIHSYNDKHPRGRKFHPEELRLHKEQWLQLCRAEHQLFNAHPIMATVGPIQALIDELQFNRVVSQNISTDLQGCLFMDDQFKRAIASGAIAILKDELKHALIEAYRLIGRANQHIFAILHHAVGSDPWANAVNRASKSLLEAGDQIVTAHGALLQFLANER